jgi:cell division protein FtsI (penicillin-binding protein 3)
MSGLRTPARPRPRPAGGSGSGRGAVRQTRRFRPGDPRHRLRVVQVVVLAMLSVVAVRVIQIQTIQGPSLAAAATKDRTRTLSEPALRGQITDRDGVALATTVESVNVTADQTLVTDPASEAQALAGVLGGDPASYQARLTGTRRFIYLAKNVTPQTWTQVQNLNLAGIFSEASSTRVYPAGPIAANVIGFVGAEGTGLAGMEYGYNTELAGTPGTIRYQGSARGQQIPTTAQTGSPAVPGLGLELTIDRDLQWKAQEALAAQVKVANADSGTVVVMDPSTGQILALATVPTFDPNRPSATIAADRGNRALADAFEPGSTAKLMTMAAALNEGKITPETHMVIPASEYGSTTIGLHRGGHTFHDSESHGTEDLTPTGILARSSNIGAILTAEKVGGGKFYDYLKAFGIGEPTGLRFPGENDGAVPAPSTWSATTFPTLAFGQGLSLNAVQAASIYATIANNGVRVAPSLVKGYFLPDGSYQAAAPSPSQRVVSAQTASSVRAMLESVVSDQGTAPNAAIPGYRVAGKTGTANIVNPACGCYKGGGYTASFIGMAPADNPKLVVAVVLTNPRNGHFGGVLAGPVFKAVMTFGLAQLLVPPSTLPPAHLRTTW